MDGAISSRTGPELAWSLWNGKTYVPRQPEKTPLFKVVRDNLETFLAEAEQRSPLGNGVPDFVEQEFRKFLSCGALAGGFARLKCESCGHEKLVPFSCKGRGLCPSCAGRRMTESAIDQVENIIPIVPVRQWVLSLPFRLRYRMAWSAVARCASYGGIFNFEVDDHAEALGAKADWRCLEKHYRLKAKAMGSGLRHQDPRFGNDKRNNPGGHHDQTGTNQTLLVTTSSTDSASVS